MGKSAFPNHEQRPLCHHAVRIVDLMLYHNILASPVSYVLQRSIRRERNELYIKLKTPESGILKGGDQVVCLDVRII